MYPGIDPDTGNAHFSGIHCPLSGVAFDAGLRYPDFIIGDSDPRGPGVNSWFVGDVKLSGNSLYNQYYKTRNDPNGKIRQFDAMVNYAGRHTHTGMVLFLTFFSGNKSQLNDVSSLLRRRGVQKGVLVFVFAATNNKGF